MYFIYGIFAQCYCNFHLFIAQMLLYHAHLILLHHTSVPSSLFYYTWYLFYCPILLYRAHFNCPMLLYLPYFYCTMLLYLVIFFIASSFCTLHFCCTKLLYLVLLYCTILLYLPLFYWLHYAIVTCTFVLHNTILACPFYVLLILGKAP